MPAFQTSTAKSAMTSRERLLCVLAGGLPDRVPVSPFVQEDYLSWFFQKTETDRLIDGVACARALGFDFMARETTYSTPHFLQTGINWTVRTDTRIVHDIFTRTTYIETPTRTLRSVEIAPYDARRIGGTSFSTGEYLIKDEADFDAFARYMPAIPAAHAQFIHEGAHHAAQHIGQSGISCPWCTGGVYNLVSRFFNVQDMMMDALCAPDYYHAYMSFFAQLIAQSNDIFARSAFDAVGVGGNIANGTMVGEDFFAQYILPYEQQALAPLQAAGKPTVYHNCGFAKNLYACYRRLGITCWETVAQTPRGDNTLVHAKEALGSDMVLAGTFDQVDFLKTATPLEIYDAAAQIVTAGKPGGKYIFAASDFLESETPVEHVKAMLQGAYSAASYAPL